MNIFKVMENILCFPFSYKKVKAQQTKVDISELQKRRQSVKFLLKNGLHFTVLISFNV